MNRFRKLFQYNNLEKDCTENVLLFIQNNRDLCFASVENKNDLKCTKTTI